MRQRAKCIETDAVGNETFETAFLPERDYVTFGSLLSHCRLSVVCNVGGPYSGGLTFRQYFFTAVYISHQLTMCKILRRSSHGNPTVGVLNARRAAK